MNTCPKISVVIPIHASMENGAFFLWRSIQALMKQTFKDFEIVITQEGTMPVNTNAGIQRARGELVKILYLDDYLANENSLQEIVDNFGAKDTWLVTGCLHDDGRVVGSYHVPEYTDDIYTGHNCIGSPSVLTMRREGALLFDTSLSWLLDCDLYKRLHDSYGPPKIVNTPNVIIGIGRHQTTHILSNEQKLKEHQYLMQKYA